MKNPIVINETQMKELRAMATDPLDDKLAKRASIILALGEGKKTRDVAKEVGINKDAVTRWKNRFLEGGIAHCTVSTEEVLLQNQPFLISRRKSNHSLKQILMKHGQERNLLNSWEFQKYR